MPELCSLKCVQSFPDYLYKSIQCAREGKSGWQGNLENLHHVPESLTKLDALQFQGVQAG